MCDEVPEIGYKAHQLWDKVCTYVYVHVSARLTYGCT